MVVTALVLTIAGLIIQPFAYLQSGATRSRAAGREYGVNLTFAVYQFDEARSAALEPITRLPSTFSSANEEIGYLKEKHKLEDVAVRHVRSVGLTSGETFTDAVLLGPEYMVFTVSPDRIARGQMALAMNVKYANEPMLEIKNVGNFKIKLRFKDPIAMMLFAELKDPVTQKIQTQYGGGQSKATPPNLRFRTGDDK